MPTTKAVTYGGWLPTKESSTGQYQNILFDFKIQEITESSGFKGIHTWPSYTNIIGNSI